MLKTFAFLIFLFAFICIVNGFTIDEIVEGELDDEVGMVLSEAAKNQTANFPFLVTLFLSDSESGDITSFAFGTIIGKNEILTSMKFYFRDYIHFYLVYNGTEIRKLDDSVELIYSEKYDEDRGWFDALVIKVPNIEFEPHQIVQLNGNPNIPSMQETITLQLQREHFYPVIFQHFPSDTCTQLGETFSVEQQTCGRGASPFIDVKENKWNIFGSTWFTVENGIPYLLGFNSFFYDEKAPNINILQNADFLCNQKFLNYEFSCRNFNESFVENVSTFSNESLEEVLSENPAVVAIFEESEGLFNWKQNFIGFGVIHSTNGFIVSSNVATSLSEIEEDGKIFVSSKNHKNVYLEDLQVEINPNKDVSSWHDIAFILSESLNFDKDERAALNENPSFHSKDLQIIEQTSEGEISWTSYDLYPAKACARAFSDIHCCEFGPEQQICGPDHPQRFQSTPLFDDHGKFVGIYSTKNQYYHGQNVDVFTRIDANLEWIKSYF